MDKSDDERREACANYWQGQRVCLRAVEPSDAEVFYRWNQDSERARHLDFLWPPTSLASVQAFAEEASRNRLEKDAYQWVITDRAGNPVGTIDTHHCNHRTGTFMYGVDIAAEERGKGYASEAIRMVLKYYFRELRYQKVTVGVHSDNIASIRLHERLGYQLEATLRRMVYSHGQLYDELMFGLTREEFDERERNATWDEKD